MHNLDCPFCSIRAFVVETEHIVAFHDRFPVAEGHTLVVPRRHVDSVFDLTRAEFDTLWQVVTEVRERLRRELQPNGFTIGVNDGAAAGQTVTHAHVHVIPRCAGDVPDPRGGIRWVLPERACYWEPMTRYFAGV
jgi:diadenosine tetraphosphate (Ap4A) HIT family hydrolase